MRILKAIQIIGIAANGGLAVHSALRHDRMFRSKVLQMRLSSEKEDRHRVAAGILKTRS